MITDKTTYQRVMGHAPSGWLADQRGAVMVVGVFMAAFLVGSLWYIIGIGDAILYRERMQDGADAVAFAAAVYHARGMNIIAMINIIMAAILAVLVAFKLVQLRCSCGSQVCINTSLRIRVDYSYPSHSILLDVCLPAFAYPQG